MTVLHDVAVGRAVAKRTVQLPHRWLIASRPSLQLVATTIDFCPTMISFLAILHSSINWPSKSGICQCALVGGLVDQDGTYVSHVATTASMPSPATPPIATKNDARPARGKGTAGGWAGLAVGLVTVATVAILLLVRHQRKRGPSADSMLGNCLLGNCNQREQQLKKDLCTAVKERAALGFLAAYNRDLFSSVGSIDEFRDRVAKLEIPRARLKPRGILGTGNYGQVRIASCSGMGGSGGGSGGGSSGDGGGGGGDPNSLVEQVAVKSRLPTEDDATVDEALLVEALVLHSLKHRHILRLVGICTSTLPVLIATELMVNGDLKSYLRASRPSQPNPKALVCLLDVAVILERVASALSHLESVQHQRHWSQPWLEARLVIAMSTSTSTELPLPLLALLAKSL